MKRVAFLVAVLCSAVALAGEFHYGNGKTRDEGCDSADRKAAKAAKQNDTCYAACDVRSCKEESDGTFTCRASSANHRGSCDSSMTRP